MSSNINPNNIDGTYPVAGQDNNSQGFRDNFTNIKTNFQYAGNEITDLQTNAILKSALTGTTLDNDMLGSLVYNGVIADFGATRVSLGTVSGSVTIDYSLGHFQTLTTSGSVQLAFTNFPAAGIAGIVSVQVTVASTAHTLTLPTVVSINNAGIQGINTSTNVISFAAIGTYTFQFITSDSGATVTVNESNQALKPYNNSSDSFVANGNISLSTTTSIIGSSTNLTGNLLTGASGQIKILAYGNASSGNTLINVVNAGWKSTGNGTANLSATGSAATFQYIGSKWYCIGNNGVTFS
jgi:hypothetical protein